MSWEFIESIHWGRYFSGAGLVLTFWLLRMLADIRRHLVESKQVIEQIQANTAKEVSTLWALRERTEREREKSSSLELNDINVPDVAP